MDWALSVTGPYESTAIVTGPMPKKPKATRPNAKTAGAIISELMLVPVVATQAPVPIRIRMERPIQKAEKLPATNPERMFNEAPPFREAMTTSLTCLEFMEVNTFTSSGMMAPAKVPQVMMLARFQETR